MLGVSALAVLALVATGCGNAGSASAPAAPPTDPATSAPTTTPSTTALPTTVPPTTLPPTTLPPTTTTLPKAPPGWTSLYRTPAEVVTETRVVQLADGHSVALVRFHAGGYRLALHVGGGDPPTGGWAVPSSAGAAVSSAERPALIGAFNGGFKADTGAGGFEVDGHVVVSLVAGAASLVIYRDGSVQVGAWGHGVPAPGRAVLSVRQNLTPLISGGTPSPEASNPGVWGAELYGVQATARSAVGTDPAGDLVYAGSMAALPADLVAALRAAGVTNAMELDINPEWVQADVAPSPGGPLAAAVPGQQRPADTYLVGWTRDFFTVLDRTTAGGG